MRDKRGVRTQGSGASDSPKLGVVLGDVRRGEDRRSVAGQQANGGQAVAGEIRCAAKVVDAERVSVPAPADVPVKHRRRGRRQVAPAVLPKPVRVHVVGDRSVMAAAFDASDEPPMGTAFQRDGVSGVIEAVLHGEHDGSTQGVESVEGIRSAEQTHAGDRASRYQVPVDRVAQGFIEAHAVLVDGESHGQAEQRRCGVASVVEIGLQRVALCGVDVDAPGMSGEVARNVRAAAGPEIVRVGGLDAAREVADVEVVVTDRRGSHDGDRLDFPGPDTQRGRPQVGSSRGPGRGHWQASASNESGSRFP